MSNSTERDFIWQRQPLTTKTLNKHCTRRQVSRRISRDVAIALSRRASMQPPAILLHWASVGRCWSPTRAESFSWGLMRPVSRSHMASQPASQPVDQWPLMSSLYSTRPSGRRQRGLATTTAPRRSAPAPSFMSFMVTAVCAWAHIVSLPLSCSRAYASSTLVAQQRRLTYVCTLMHHARRFGVIAVAVLMPAQYFFRSRKCRVAMLQPTLYCRIKSTSFPDVVINDSAFFVLNFYLCRRFIELYRRRCCLSLFSVSVTCGCAV